MATPASSTAGAGESDQAEGAAGESSALSTSDAVAMDTLGPDERTADDRREGSADQQQQQRKRGRPRLIDDAKDRLIRSVMQQRGTTNARMIQDELKSAHSVTLTYEVIRKRVKQLSLQAAGGAQRAHDQDTQQTCSPSDADAANRGGDSTETVSAAVPAETGGVAGQKKTSLSRTRMSAETAAEPESATKSSSHQQIARDLDMLAETVRTIVGGIHGELEQSDECKDQTLEDPVGSSGNSDDAEDSGEDKAESSAVVGPAQYFDEAPTSSQLEPEQLQAVSPSFVASAARGENGEYALEICQLVVAKFSEGKTHKQIAAELQMPATSVQTIIKKAKRKGTVLPAQRAGRPRATSETLEKVILDLVRSKPAMSARAVQAQLAKKNLLAVSFETIRRRVRDCRKQLQAGGKAMRLNRDDHEGDVGESSDSDEEKRLSGGSEPLLPADASSLLATGGELALPAKRRKYGEYSNELREACVQKHETEGLTYAAISSQLSIPHDTVRAIVRKAKKTGTVRTAPRSGRPRKTSDIVDKVIIQAVKANQRCTAKMIQEDLWTVFNVKVSCETVRRRVKANTKQRLLSSPSLPDTAQEQASSLAQPAPSLLLGYPMTAAGPHAPMQPVHLGSNAAMLTPLPLPMYQSPPSAAPPSGSRGVIQSILNLQAQHAQHALSGSSSAVTSTAHYSRPAGATTTATTNSLTDSTASNARKKRNDYSLEVREQCVSMHAEGHGYRRIGQELKMPHTTVRAIVEKVQRTGSVLPAARSGRPRKTDEIVDKVILQAVKNNEKCSARMIQEELQDAYGVKVSCETIRRRVKDHSRQRHANGTASTAALLVDDSPEPSQQSRHGFELGVPLPVQQSSQQPVTRSSFQAQLHGVNQFSEFTSIL